MGQEEISFCKIRNEYYLPWDEDELKTTFSSAFSPPEDSRLRVKRLRLRDDSQDDDEFMAKLYTQVLSEADEIGYLAVSFSMNAYMSVCESVMTHRRRKNPIFSRYSKSLDILNKESCLSVESSSKAYLLSMLYSHASGSSCSPSVRRMERVHSKLPLHFGSTCMRGACQNPRTPLLLVREVKFGLC
jgi:hypothetical protein